MEIEFEKRGVVLDYGYSDGSWLVVRTEDLSFKSKLGVVGGENLQKAGASVKGVVLFKNSHLEVGTLVEFQTNLGIRIREDIYAVKIEHIFFIGDLDELLKKEIK